MKNPFFTESNIASELQYCSFPAVAEYYYNEIIENASDMETLNVIINEIIKDDRITGRKVKEYTSDFTYLCTVASSLGFRFGKHFNLI